jgi:hypothetical protein
MVRKTTMADPSPIANVNASIVGILHFSGVLAIEWFIVWLFRFKWNLELGKWVLRGSEMVVVGEVVEVGRTLSDMSLIDDVEGNIDENERAESTWPSRSVWESILDAIIRDASQRRLICSSRRFSV